MSKFKLFSESEFKSRKDNLKDQLDADVNIIFNRSDLFYYSGTGLDGIVWYDKNDDDTTRYVQRNKELAIDESYLDVKKMESFRLFKNLAKGRLIETIGLELDLLPYRTVSYIQKAFGNPEIIDIGGSLREIRSVKSSKEQEYMKQATKQTDESFEHIRDKIKSGVSELELAAEIEYFLRREGHPGFVNVRMFHHNLTSLAMVMTGESTATLNSNFGPVSGQGLCRLHKNGPSHRKVKDGDAVLIDTTGVVEGYTADETRTFFVGQPEKKLLDGYEAAKEVQKYVENNMIAGKNPPDLFNELWELVKEMNMDQNFMGIGNDVVPFIGHGIGLELDELPIITDKYKLPLQEGNIVAVEPKFIFDNPKTGVGIEDSYIVGKNKAERITKTPW